MTEAIRSGVRTVGVVPISLVAVGLLLAWRGFRWWWAIAAAGVVIGAATALIAKRGGRGAIIHFNTGFSITGDPGADESAIDEALQ